MRSQVLYLYDVAYAHARRRICRRRRVRNQGIQRVSCDCAFLARSQHPSIFFTALASLWPREYGPDTEKLRYDADDDIPRDASELTNAPDEIRARSGEVPVPMQLRNIPRERKWSCCKILTKRLGDFQNSGKCYDFLFLVLCDWSSLFHAFIKS